MQALFDNLIHDPEITCTQLSLVSSDEVWSVEVLTPISNGWLHPLDLGCSGGEAPDVCGSQSGWDITHRGGCIIKCLEKISAIVQVGEERWRGMKLSGGIIDAELWIAAVSSCSLSQEANHSRAIQIARYCNSRDIAP